MESVEYSEEALRALLKLDETARDLFKRVLLDKLVTSVPFLDASDAKPGSVVGLDGGSSTCKSEILIQASASCILPKVLDGVHYGGAEAAVIFFDLDGKFDMHRLVSVLRTRIRAAQGGIHSEWVEAIMRESLDRFYLITCLNTLVLLASLKLLHPQLTQMAAKHGTGCFRLLCIDSIGASHWPDRARANATVPSSARKEHMTMHGLWSAVTQELRCLVQRHRPLVLVSKCAIYPPKSGSSTGFRASKQEDAEGLVDPQQNAALAFKDFMPAVWRDFISHRVVLSAAAGVMQGKESGEKGPLNHVEIKWDKPRADHFQQYVVKEVT